MDTIPGRAVQPDHSDEEIMRQLTAGQQGGLGSLYRRYAALILRIARASLDRGEAEEVVQDVFVAVWGKAATFTPDRGAFRPWVLQIARHRIFNALRARRHRPQLKWGVDNDSLEQVMDDRPGPGEEALRACVQSALRSAIEQLPAPQRDAVSLAFLEDLTHEQVAAQLNVPLGTVKTRIRAGLKKLHGPLTPLAPERIPAGGSRRCLPACPSCGGAGRIRATAMHPR
jgi:RNA polymerase sigma factor (sigma-70 family)